MPRYKRCHNNCGTFTADSLGLCDACRHQLLQKARKLKRLHLMQEAKTRRQDAARLDFDSETGRRSELPAW